MVLVMIIMMTLLIIMTKVTSFDIRVALLVVTMSGGGSHDKGWRSSLKNNKVPPTFKKDKIYKEQKARSPGRK